MKKRLLALGIIFAMCVAFCSCAKEKAGLSAKEASLKLSVGKQHTIELEQSNVENIRWESGDEAIATVSQDGTVTAKKSGVTVISGRTDDSFVHVGVIVESSGTYTDEQGNVVDIVESDITEIVVGVKGGGKNDISVKKGDTFQLRAYTTPENSKDKIEWKSENTSVVAVNKEGTMSVVGKGTTKVIAYAPNGVKGEMVVRAK